MTDDDQKQGNTSQEQVAPSPKTTDQEAAEEIEKTEKIRKIWKRVRKSPTFYGSVLYGWVCLIGMLHARSYYQPLGVDIFDFAEPFDFLLIAISKASIVLDIGISTVFVGICFGLVFAAIIIILIFLLIARFIIYDIKNLIVCIFKSTNGYIHFIIRIFISLLHIAWVAYIASVRTAWKTYATLRRTVWGTYIASVRTAWKTYATSVRAAWKTYTNSVRTAWKGLKESQRTILTRFAELYKRNEKSRREARNISVALLRRFFYRSIAAAFIFATLFMPSYRGEQDARTLVSDLKSKQVGQIPMLSWMYDKTSCIYSTYIQPFSSMDIVFDGQGNQQVAQHVRVALRQDSAQPGTRLPEPERTLFLGTISSFHFFYEYEKSSNSGTDSKGQNGPKTPAAQHQEVVLGSEKGRPFIIPTANIASLEFNPKKIEVKPRVGLSDVTDAIANLDTTIRNLKFNAIFRMESGDVIFDTTKIAEAVMALDETVRNFKPPVTPDPDQIVKAINTNTERITTTIKDIKFPPEVRNHCVSGWKKVATIGPFREGHDALGTNREENRNENGNEPPCELVTPNEFVNDSCFPFEAKTLQQLMLIGRVDVTPLNEERRGRYGSNNGLAQARAKWVRDELVEKLKTKWKLDDPEKKEALRERTILLSAGPLHVGTNDKKSVPEEERKLDRSVEVWVCGGAKT